MSACRWVRTDQRVEDARSTSGPSNSPGERLVGRRYWTLRRPRRRIADVSYSFATISASAVLINHLRLTRTRLETACI